MSSRRDEMLAALGLVRWVPRGAGSGADGPGRAPPGAAPRVAPGAAPGDAPGDGGRRWGPYEPVQLPEAPVAVVVLISAEPVGPGAGTPAGALLAKILGALKVPLPRFAVLRAPPDAALGPEPVERAGAPDVPVLAFVGTAPAPERWTRLPTLAAMLADDAAKRPAWAKLKPLVGRLG